MKRLIFLVGSFMSSVLWSLTVCADTAFHVADVLAAAAEMRRSSPKATIDCDNLLPSSARDLSTRTFVSEVEALGAKARFESVGGADYVWARFDKDVLSHYNTKAARDQYLVLTYKIDRKDLDGVVQKATCRMFSETL